VQLTISLCRIAVFMAILAFSLGDTTVADEPTPNSLFEGLVAYWSFDEGEGDILFDKTGNHNEVVLGAPLRVEGKQGFALQFDGVDDSVAIRHSESLMPTDAITLVSWVKILGPAQAHHGIIGKNGYISGYRLLVHGTNMKVLFQLTGEEGYNLWSSIPVADDRWHFIAATYDGSKMRLYIDGTKDPNEADRAGPIDANTSPVMIGKPQYALNGLIDEVRIYNRALSEEEIYELMTN
jgi:hypothetical protein